MHERNGGKTDRSANLKKMLGCASTSTALIYKTITNTINFLFFLEVFMICTMPAVAVIE